ncbi:MAG TPA: YjgN family protein [Xanthomonadaceae bacterium]|nr:YjgN family protein [Xanthomonadaceae bacterium]
MMHVAAASADDLPIPSTPPPPAVLEYDFVETLPFRFSGQTGEYFRIWIVNLALTLLTLGIYSAWAKVRTQRYFYAHTSVAGAPFEYLARPVPILIGRLIAAALFAAYLATANLAPAYEPFALLALLVAIPWIVVRSLAFRAHNSAWRSLRFGFAGSTGRAYVEYLLWYVPVLFTFGLLWPYVAWRQKRFMVSNHRYGGQPFAFQARVTEFYVIWLLAIAGVVGLIVSIIVLMGVIGAASGALSSQGGDDAEARIWLVMVPAMVLIYGGYFAIFVYIQTATTNLVLNATDLASNRLLSRLRFRHMLWLYLSNTVAILATVGLAIPWARIRMARYRASRTQLVPHGDLDAFVAESARTQRAIGQEIGDFFDVDLGF